jgi:hypothetical protein
LPHLSIAIDDAFDRQRDFLGSLNFVDYYRLAICRRHQSFEMTLRVGLDSREDIFIVERDEVAMAQHFSNQRGLSGLSWANQIDDTSAKERFIKLRFHMPLIQFLHHRRVL